MLSYAVEKLKSLARTKRSLLNVVVRHMITTQKQFDQLQQEEIDELHRLAVSGDVDQVNKKTHHAEDDLERIEMTATDSEGSVLIAQDRVLNHFVDVLKWFKQVEESSELKAFMEAHPQTQLKAFVSEERQALRALLSEDHKDLQNELLLLKRAHANEEGVVQGFVLTNVSKVQELFDSLRTERRKTTKTEREEDELSNEFKTLLHNLSKKDEQQVAAEVQEIKQETRMLREDFTDMMKGFVRIISIIVFLWFHYKKQGEKPLQDFLEQLRSSGYPAKDLDDLVVHLKKVDDETRDDAQRIVNVAIRSFRLHFEKIPDL
jgi:hypothetical protein